MAHQLPTVMTDDLRKFHATHFPHAPLPVVFLHGVAGETADEEPACDDDDDLGYYEDGTPRTLTDEQIAMFRHTEIQTILRKRRRRLEDGLSLHPHPAAPSPSPAPVIPAGQRDSPAGTLATEARAPSSSTSEALQGPSDQTEELKHQWTALSTKSKARNARNRKKNRQNYRTRKKEERKKREQEQQLHDDYESDEWDPWHQANGPDAQKDTPIELEY